MTLDTTEVWTQLHERILSFIRRRVADRSQAEDILQDVFTRVHTNLSGLRDTERVRSWVYQITRNAITDYYRARDGEPVPYAESLGDPNGDVSSARELASCIQPLLNDLSAKYKEAILLTEFQGLTQKAAAERVGLSLSGMKSRVQRGRVRLREKFLECCHIEFDRRGGVADYDVLDYPMCGPMC